jgi:hypothetical protein
MSMSMEEAQKNLLDMPDEVMESLKFVMPWQYDTSEGGYKDPDGFDADMLEPREDTPRGRKELQSECWKKFNNSPQVNTSVRGLQGRLTGLGFETTSGELSLQEVIEEVELDYRNRLYYFWPQYIGRSLVEGELFQMLTVHEDGFIEVDFIDPISLQDGGNDDTGIIFHPYKTLMPLFYIISTDNGKFQVPSIFVAHNPGLVDVASKHPDFKLKDQSASRSRKKVYKPLGGYYRFIVSWNKGLMTKRAVSYLRTTLVWLNHYENLKKYEIDHKKSAGSYVWAFQINDAAMFKLWLSLTDEQRRKTGILAKKTPGGTLILPPGVELKVVNPSLSPIREQDTDILEMIGSGLNEEEGTMMGRSRSTFASANATKGPMSDRISDEIAWFSRYLRYDFWGSVFLLKSKVDAKFKNVIAKEEVIGFTPKKRKNEVTGKVEYDHEPVMKKRKYLACQLIDISFPTSEMIDFEGRAKGLLGVKHGPISETLGVSNEDVARRMGFGGYPRLRLRKATEDYYWPKLLYGADAESMQEKLEGEKPKPKNSNPKQEQE